MQFKTLAVISSFVLGSLASEGVHLVNCDFLGGGSGTPPSSAVVVSNDS
jgi:hypothetical protein